ncbi:MAG TPA: hypothetical protein VMH89_00930 [Candidatus Acidoferrum sp.]|nr:hypothetical protein [Candidatus Acidoferrum sp.]
METFINFAAVIMTTIVALFGALALQALLLRGVFALMQPATAARRAVPPSVERGTQLVVRAYAKAR